MSNESGLLLELWEAINSKCESDVTLQSLTSVYFFNMKFLRQVEPLEFVSLLTIVLLERLRFDEKLSLKDIFRSADKAKYELRKSIKKLPVSLEATPKSGLGQLYEELIENLTSEELTFVLARLESKTIEEAANRLGVSKRKIQLRLRDIRNRMSRSQ